MFMEEDRLYIGDRWYVRIDGMYDSMVCMNRWYVRIEGMYESMVCMEDRCNTRIVRLGTPEEDL